MSKLFKDTEQESLWLSMSAKRQFPTMPTDQALQICKMQLQCDKRFGELRFSFKELELPDNDFAKVLAERTKLWEKQFGIF